MSKEADKRMSMGKKRKGVVFPAVSASASTIPMNYPVFLLALKKRIRKERLRIILASNTAMVMLYWDIGQSILKKQNDEGWGSKVIDRLSADLRKEFPEMKGFSPRNLKYMRSLATAWPDKAIVQRVIAQLPWRSNIALLDKLENSKERLWYAMKTIKYGWSQPVLCLQIEGQTHKREGKAVNNFSIALLPDNSDMAGEVFKDPYTVSGENKVICRHDYKNAIQIGNVDYVCPLCKELLDPLEWVFMNNFEFVEVEALEEKESYGDKNSDI